MKPTLKHRLWFLGCRLVYAAGFRPSPIGYFFSYDLEAQEQWRTGKR